MRLDYENPFPERLMPRYLLDRQARLRRRRLHDAAAAFGGVVLLLLFAYVVVNCMAEFIAD